MFGLFNKKKTVKNKKNAANDIDFNPIFDTPEDFIKCFCVGEKNASIGKFNDVDVDVTLGTTNCNDILIISDENEKINKQFVIPFIKQKKMSYIVYDPKGTCYDSSAEEFSKAGYDVQLIDFNDTENRSRIDIFETLSVLSNPYWLSLIISGSIKCNQNEVQIVFNLLMASMQYLLSIDNTVNFNSLYGIFNKIRVGDVNVINTIIKYPNSKKYIMQIANFDKETMLSACEKLDNYFFKNVYKKIKDPNILTMATHLKQTVFFIKEVPQRYKCLMTIFMFNIKVLNVICGYGKSSTVIIDAADAGWYNRSLLSRICKDIGNINSGISEITIMNNIGNQEYRNAHNNQIIIYVDSKDDETNQYIVEKTKIKNWNEKGQQLISNKYFEGNPLPDIVLESSPIAIDKLPLENNCIIISPNNIANPFQCDLLS